MIYDMDSLPASKEEIKGAKEDARRFLRARTKWAIYGSAAFLLSCASVVPFSKGFPLHDHAEPFGRILVYLSMTLLIPFVITVGLAINAWFFVRAMEKIEE